MEDAYFPSHCTMTFGLTQQNLQLGSCYPKLNDYIVQQTKEFVCLCCEQHCRAAKVAHLLHVESHSNVGVFLTNTPNDLLS